MIADKPRVEFSLRYASKKYWPQIAKALLAIYTAPTVQPAEAN
jgi:hypothetical protein